jgi:predicted nucleic acid-binding protein
MVKEIDVDDTYFVALHLYLGHKLWTSDKKLIAGVEAKGYKIFITTAELRKKLYKK